MAEVEVSRPIQFRGYLSRDVLPFELVRRVEVKPPHVWLSPGARVLAWEASEGMAYVARPEHPTMGGSMFAAKIRCTDLALAGVTAIPPVQGHVLQTMTTLLYSAPEGERLFGPESMQPIDVELVERKDNWSRVRGRWSFSTIQPYQAYVPFDFDAWTPTPVVPATDSEGSLRHPPAPRQARLAPTHRSNRPIPLYDTSKARVTTLAEGVRFGVGRTFGEFVEVRIPGVFNSAETNFWMRGENLTSSGAVQ